MLLSWLALCSLGTVHFAPPQHVDDKEMPTDFMGWRAPLPAHRQDSVAGAAPLPLLDPQVVLGREFNTERSTDGDGSAHWVPSSPEHFSSVIHFWPKQRPGGAAALNVTTVGGVLVDANSSSSSSSTNNSVGPFVSSKVSRRITVSGPLSNGTFVAAEQRAAPSLRFTGALPRPSKCWPGLGCMRMGGATSIALPATAGGGVLMTTMVQWGGCTSTTCNASAGHRSCNQSSVVAWYSTDCVSWVLRGVLADAFNHPSSLEGPNEHDVALLADGVTLLAVVRLDGGDGGLKPPRQPYEYLPYFQLTSTDWGRTWQGASIPNAGCVRPRLLLLGNTLLLSGGRFRAHGNTSDVLLWESADGRGKKWRPYSLSYQHNALARPGTPLFTADVNNSGPLFTLPRQTNAYTSLVRLNESSALVFYDQRFKDQRLGVTLSKSFSMVLTVSRVYR